MDLKVGEKDGFAIVVADKRFPVVLAYSSHGKYSDLKEKGSENLQTYVENIPNDVKAVLADPRYLTTDLTNDTSKIFKAFPYYNDRDEIYATEDFSGIWHDVALLRESVLWGQFSPYNDSLPINPKKGKPFPVGCVNVALSQIMAYYKYPAKYDWDVMAVCVNIANIPFFPAEITAIITTFIKELTTITKTKFKEEFNTSAVNIPNMVAALDTLGYKYDPLILYNSNAVRTSLKAKKFVIATGRAQTDEVHAFVLSGYWKFTIPQNITNLQNGTNLGVNWGNAGGFGDGWYLVEYGNKMITDLGLAQRDPITGSVTGPNYTETLYILPGICPK